LTVDTVKGKEFYMEALSDGKTEKREEISGFYRL